MMHTIDDVVLALRAVRAPRMSSEYDLHALVAEALAAGGIAFRHEARIAPRRRIDILCEGGVGVEVKRGRPAARPLLRQLTAYAACDGVAALVLIAERPPALPPALCGKPLACVGLQRLWGVAL